jgi:hypothetical protein
MVLMVWLNIRNEEKERGFFVSIDVANNGVGDRIDAIAGVYEILCVNDLLILGESPLKHNGKSIERRLPITDRHSPLLSDIL